MSTQTPPRIETDYFTVFNLDPAKWDQKVFDKAVSAARNYWHNPKKIPSSVPLNSADALVLLEEINRVMLLPEERKKQADKYYETQRKKLETDRVNLLLDLEPFRREGEMTRDAVEKFRAYYKGKVDDSEVNAALTGLKITDSATATNQRPDAKGQMQDSTFDDIRKNLGIEGHGFQSLYEFLNANMGTHGRTSYSRSEYKEFAEAWWSKLNATAGMDKSNPQTNARLQLASHAKAVFLSNEEQNKYDRALAASTLQHVDQWILRHLRYTKDLSVNHIAYFLERAKAETPDIDLEAVRAQILKAAHGQKATIVAVPTLEPIHKLIVCARCGAINSESGKLCTGCGQELFFACPAPNCANTVSAGDKNCSKCGFNLAARNLAEKLVDEAETAIARHDFNVAGDLVTKAVRAWPAINSDPLRKLIQSLQTRLEQSKSTHYEGLANVDAHIAKREFYAARTALRKLGLDASNPDRKRREESIDKVVTTVEQAYLPLMNLQGEQAVTAFQKLLIDCADFGPAQTRLKQLPPEPPADLSVEVQGSVVQLEWKPSISKDVSYVIVRKSGSRPLGVADGDTVGKAHGTIFDDSRPPVGQQLYYGVFTERAGAHSQTPAASSVPVLVTAEVTNEMAITGASQLTLRWTPPAGVHKVFAVRSNSGQPPLRPIDGMQIQSVNLKEVVDSGLKDGDLYHYRIFCEFLTHDRKSVITPGVAVSATPQTPPKPINDLVFTPNETGGQKELIISWAAPTVGRVHLITSDSDLLRSDQAVPATTLGMMGTPRIAQGSSLTVNRPANGIAYYTAAVVVGPTAYLGKSYPYVDIPNVTNLIPNNYGSRIEVRWDWPQDIDEVVVSYQSGAAPSAITSLSEISGRAASRRVTRAEYNSNGSFGLEWGEVPNEPLHFLVQSIQRRGREAHSSTGSRTRLVSVREVGLNYEIRAAKWGKKRSLIVRSTEPTTLPPLHLVAKEGGPPFSAGDGDSIIDFPSMSISSELELPFELHRSWKNHFVRLFPISEGENSVSILTPSLDKLKL